MTPLMRGRPIRSPSATSARETRLSSPLARCAFSPTPGDRGGYPRAGRAALAAWALLGICLGAPQPAHATDTADRPALHSPHAPPPHGAAPAPAPINWVGCAADDVARSGPPLALALLNFTLLVLVLLRLGRRPLRTFLDTRQRELREQIAEAAALRAQAEQQLASARRQLERVQGEVAELLATAAREAEHEREHLLREATEESRRIIAGAERTLRQEIERIKRQLEVGAIQAALQAAETLLRERLTTEDQQRLREECLGQLTAPAPGARR